VERVDNRPVYKVQPELTLKETLPAPGKKKNKDKIKKKNRNKPLKILGKKTQTALMRNTTG